MTDSTEQEQDFELVDEEERKSSTSDSFEAVDDKKTDSQSVSDNEGDEAVKKAENENREVEEAKLPFVDQSIKDDAERVKDKDGEDLVEEALRAPIRPDQEQFYTSEDSRKAITYLIAFSAMMFTVPLLVMATLYYWVFIDHFHLPPSEAMLYSGICAALVVILIAAAFCYIAWKEEKDAEDKLKADKKKE